MLLPKDTMLYYFVSSVVKVMRVKNLLVVEDYARVLMLRWSWSWPATEVPRFPTRLDANKSGVTGHLMDGVTTSDHH